jgi:hypothetical protein
MAAVNYKEQNTRLLMKLIYSIPDKLYYIQDFLDYPAYKKLHCDVFKSKLINLKSTKKIWSKGLKYGYKDFVKKTILDINYGPLQKIKILLENNPFYKIKFNSYNPMLYSMKNGSGINWHSDYGHEYGITYYIKSEDGMIDSAVNFYLKMNTLMGLFLWWETHWL